MRYLSEDFAACFGLVDSIATDHGFNEEEEQIFRLLALTSKTSHPNASACLCKIALAVEGAPIQLPVSLSYHAAIFVRSKALISARCRLSEEQELRLLELIHTQKIKSSAADTVLQQSNDVIIKAAALGGSPKPGAQAKMVDELHKSVGEAAAEAGVLLPLHEVPQLVSEWLRSQEDDDSEQKADLYDMKACCTPARSVVARIALVASLSLVLSLRSLNVIHGLLVVFVQLRRFLLVSPSDVCEDSFCVAADF